MRAAAVLVVAVASTSCGVEAPRDELGRTAPRFTVSRETTYFTGPLRADGSVDYVAALNELYGSGITPENNATPALLSVLGEPVPEDKARLMGLDRARRPTARFAGGASTWSEYDQWRRDHGRPPLTGLDENASRRLNQELLAATARPWSRQEHPRIAEWLADMEPALHAIDEASTRPRHWVPITSMWEMPGVELVRSRNMASALCARAMLALGHGGVDDAVADLSTVLRLGYLQAHDPLLTRYLVALSATATAFEALPSIAARARLRPNAVRQMLSSVEALGSFPPPSGAIESFERAQFLDRVAQLAFRGEWDAMKGDRASFRLEPDQRNRVDWDYLMRLVNQHLDAVIECQNAPTAEARRGACLRRDRLTRRKSTAWMMNQMLAARFGRSTAGIEVILDTVLAVAMPGLVHSEVPFRELQARQRLGETALLLKLYELETGRFPRRLEGLPEGNRHGVSTAPQEHGYRFSYRTTDGGYMYTATPEELGFTARSFCIDGTGALVARSGGGEPPIETGRCLAAQEGPES